MRILVALLIALAALPAPAGAQTSSPPSDTELRLQKQPRRIIVSPRPAPETAVQDSDQVRKEIERDTRADTYSREMPTQPSRRPDLDQAAQQAPPRAGQRRRRDHQGHAAAHPGSSEC